MTADCFNCDQGGRLASLPPRDRVYVGDHWRIAHAWSALPGWLVLISRRHLLSLADLQPDEAAEMGQMLRAASAALHTMVGCAKTYVVLYAEVAGFEHLHLHVIPRMLDLDPAYRGGGIFQLLKRPEAEWVPADERDRLAVAISDRMQHELSRA
jgi:diadenosine tetraphosphate (Ap4A) HIT family hydrolase